MFYCESCRVKNQWPEGFSHSYGACEVCGKMSQCYDVQSGNLPATPQENQPGEAKRFKYVPDYDGDGTIREWKLVEAEAGDYCLSSDYDRLNAHVGRYEAASQGIQDQLTAERAKRLASEQDAERYQALREYLTVARDEPGGWTCWLELACIPTRSQTTDPQDRVDWLVKVLKERST